MRRHSRWPLAVAAPLLLLASSAFATPVGAWTLIDNGTRALAVDPVHDQVFVGTGAGLQVIDGSTGTNKATFGVHGGAYGAGDVRVFGDRAYVVSRKGISADIATEVYNTATLERVATVPCGMTTAAAADTVWMSSHYLAGPICSNDLIRFDPATNTTTNIANTFNATRLLANPARPDELLLTNNGSMTYRVDMRVDPTTALATTSIDLSSLTPAPNGATLYGLDGSGSLVQYDALTLASLGVVPGSPTGIARFAITGSGGGKLAYVLSASETHVRVAALAAPGTQLSDDEMFPPSGALLAWNATGTRLYASGSVFNILPRASSHMAGGYHALNPQRILDTRDGTGTGTATPLARGAVDLQVTGRGGVPASDVLAVVLNVTATNGSASSRFLTAYPTGSSTPFTSNVNYEPGRTVANLVTVQIGAGGKISIVNDYGVAPSGQTVDVVVDVVGYYDNGVARGGRFNAVAPERVLDTRSANGVPTTTPVAAQQQIDVQVTGRGGVPATNVSAVVLNLTATDGTHASYASAWPQGQTRPGTSSVNWPAATTVANLVTVGVGPTGQVSLYNHSGDVALVADVIGWYDSTGTSGAVFWPVTPTRRYDTRLDHGGGPVQAGETRSVEVQSDVAAATVGVVAQLTATNGAQAGYLTAAPPGATVPITSSVNWAPGKNTSNLAISGTGNPSVSFGVTNGSPGAVDVIVDVYGYFVTPDN